MVWEPTSLHCASWMYMLRPHPVQPSRLHLENGAMRFHTQENAAPRLRIRPEPRGSGLVVGQTHQDQSNHWCGQCHAVSGSCGTRRLLSLEGHWGLLNSPCCHRQHSMHCHRSRRRLHRHRPAAWHRHAPEQHRTCSENQQMQPSGQWSPQCCRNRYLTHSQRIQRHRRRGKTWHRGRG